MLSWQAERGDRTAGAMGEVLGAPALTQGAAGVYIHTHIIYLHSHTYTCVSQPLCEGCSRLHVASLCDRMSSTWPAFRL